MKTAPRDELPSIQDLLMKLRLAGLDLYYNRESGGLREFLEIIYRVHWQIRKSPHLLSYEKALEDEFEMSATEAFLMERAATKCEYGMGLSGLLIELSVEDLEEVYRERWEAIIDRAYAKGMLPNDFVKEFDNHSKRTPHGKVRGLIA